MANKDFKVENLDKTLEMGTDILKKLGIDYIITGGTILGIYRDNTLLAHDTDVDVDVLCEDIPDTAEFLKKLKENVEVDDIDNNVVFRDNYFTIYFYHETNPTKVPFDIFLMFKKGRKRYRHFFQPDENPNTEKCIVFPEHYYHKDTWKTIEYKGRSYPVPGKTEEYLEYFFGKDWKTPIAKWGWSESEASHIFGDYKEWEKS